MAKIPKDRDVEIKRIQIAVGEVLRKFRLEAGISQVNLGLDADYHWSHISEIERGKRQAGIGVIFMLCKHIGVTPSQLMAEVEKKLKWK